MSIKPEDIVKDIFETYNLSTDKGIKAALRQAAWVSVCKVKGWD